MTETLSGQEDDIDEKSKAVHGPRGSLVPATTWFNFSGILNTESSAKKTYHYRNPSRHQAIGSENDDCRNIQHLPFSLYCMRFGRVLDDYYVITESCFHCISIELSPRSKLPQ